MNAYFEFQTDIINNILLEEKSNKQHIKIFKNKLKDILNDEIQNIMFNSKMLKDIDEFEDDNRVYESTVLLNNESIPIIIKTSSSKNLLFEYFVGICGTNFLREKTPCFSNILGKFSYEDNNYIVYENIIGDSFKKVISTEKPYHILRYLLCILLALEYGQQEINFVHYDVHSDNIILKDEPTTLSFRIGYKTYSIHTNKVPVFIDYEFSHFVPKFTNIPFGGKYFPTYSIDPTITNRGYDMYKIIMYILFSLDVDRYNELKWILEFYKDKYDEYGIYKNRNDVVELKDSFEKGYDKYFSWNTYDNISPIDFINWIQEEHPDIFNEYIEVEPLDLKQCIDVKIDTANDKYPKVLLKELEKINLNIYSPDLIYINKLVFPNYLNYINLYNTYYLFAQIPDKNYVFNKLEKYKSETRTYIFNNLKNNIIDNSLDFYNNINNLKILYPELYPFLNNIKQNYIKNALHSKQIYYLSTDSNCQLKYLFKCDKNSLFQLLKKHLVKPNFNFTKSDSELYSIMKSFKKNYASENNDRGLYRVKDLEQLNLGSNEINMYLDYGGGNGDITKSIANWLKLPKDNSFCMDISTWEQHARIQKYPNDLTYIDITELSLFPFSDNTFDFITCFQVLHHIKCIDLSLKELSRVLKNGGILVLREHDCRDVIDMMLIDVEHSIYEMVIENTNNPSYLSDYFAYYRSEKEWTELLSKYGFKRIKETFAKGPTRYYYAVYIKL